MLPATPEHAEADAVFERLRQSTAYLCADETIKQAALRRLWPLCTTTLAKQLADEEFGFGFLAEAFAKESPSIKNRGNTEAGARLEALFLASLQTDAYLVFGDGASRCNPDLIWFKIRGRKIVCTGIGEIKSSLEALAKKPDQLAYQSRNVQALIAAVETAKKRPDLAFLRQKKFERSETFEQLLILPRGNPRLSASTPYLPPDWTIMTFEWSYNELVFIAQQLTPGFRAEIAFGENEYARYAKAIDQIFTHAHTIIEVLFQDLLISKKSFNLITLLTLTLGIHPNDQADLELLRNTFAPENYTTLFREYPITVPVIGRYSSDEKIILEKLTALGIDRPHIIRFITTRRTIQKTYRKKIGALMERLPTFNPFKHF